MIAIGIDPGNSHTGMALVQDAHDFRNALIDIHIVTMPQDVVEAVHGPVRDTIGGWLRMVDATRVAAPLPRLAIERAPPMVRADVNHGAQAAIGYAQGLLGGLIIGSTRPWFSATELVDVSAWRENMILQAARHGLLLEAPTRASVERADAGPAWAMPGSGKRFDVERGNAAGELVRVWRGCAHRESFANLGSLTLSSANACPACAARKLEAGQDPAEAVRSAWKALACRFVGHFWPESYLGMVSVVRGRARSPDKPDHELAGVADACEAVGVGLWSIATAPGAAP